MPKEKTGAVEASKNGAVGAAKGAAKAAAKGATGPAKGTASPAIDLQTEQLGQNCRNCSRQCNARQDDAQGTPEQQYKRFSLPSASELAVGASWGCLSAWVYMCFKSLNIYSSVGESVLDATYLVSIIAICVTLFTAAHFDSVTERFMKKAAFRWLLPVGMSISTVLMAAGAYASGPLSLVLTCVAGVLSGMFSGLFLLRIGIAFSKLCLRACVIGAAVGIILQPVLFSLFLLFGAFEATAFATSIPIISSVLLAFGMKELERQGVAPGIANECLGDAAGKTELGRAIAQSSPFAPSERMKFTIKLTIGGALVGFASEAARTLYVQVGTINEGAVSYAGIEGIGWLVATCIILVIALTLLTMKTERMARNCYHTVMIMLVFAILLLPGAVLRGGPAADAGQALNSAAYSCFSMLIWVVMISFAARHSNATIRIIAHARAGWAAGPLVGMLLGRLVLRVLGLDVDNSLLVMSLCTLAILIAMGFVFTETDLARCMDILPLQRKQHFRDKCKRVAKEFALSERETEVMVLLAKGNSLSYIQETLFISKSTASTHRQHIYRKIGIHSQQELIDLVQGSGK